ncbi:P-loop NTPase fold protein [Pseudomonas frederiksbergensis]|uniref:P-loop NTPase fold protein n=1 Tax=Pseudomonas frederiksbergensis TaxID=104087 RepID=UPI0032E45599
MQSSYQKAQEILLKLLNNHSYKVIALSGKWGTGKTHLWGLVKKQLQLSTAQASQPIFVSIFGAKTSNDLKLRLLQNGSLKDDKKYKDFVSAGGKLVKGIAGKFIPGLAVEEIILLSLPKLLGGRLVVIDDVERKHKNLDIDEILGFINEYSETYKTRFLLLLNTDKLEDEIIWRKLHEKVIDIELKLQPASSEAFDVASINSNLSFLECAREATTSLGITNIRIIKRIIRVFSELLEGYGPLEEYVQKRIIPSTILLTAIHYRGIASDITSEYFLQHNSFSKILSRAQRTADELKWDDVINKLSISSCDDYEFLVQDYLQTGVVDKEKLDKIINKYQTDLERNQVHEKVRFIFESYYWDPLFDHAKALELAEDLFLNTEALTGNQVSAVADILTELGETNLSEKLIGRWIEINEPLIDPNESDEFNMGRSLHPAIEALNTRIRERQYPPLTLEEAIERVRSNSGWGDRENICFQNSTPTQYEETLKTLRGSELAKFICENFSLLRTIGLNDSFQHGINNFKEASTNIVRSAPESRLAFILKREFEKNNIPLHINE